MKMSAKILTVVVMRMPFARTQLDLAHAAVRQGSVEMGLIAMVSKCTFSNYLLIYIIQGVSTKTQQIKLRVNKLY